MSLERGPSRCPHCQCRMLKEHGQGTVFDTWQTLYWQCVACGAIMDDNGFGQTSRWPVVGFGQIVLAPGELKELRKESARRSG